MTIDKDSLYRYDTSLLRDAVQRAGFDPDCPGPFALKSRINLGTVERILSGHTKGMSKERAELIKGTTAMMICRYLRIEPHELCPGAPQPMPGLPQRSYQITKTSKALTTGVRTMTLGCAASFFVM